MELNELHQKMKNCFQTSNINMLEHGLMVNRYYNKLLKGSPELLEHFSGSEKDLNLLLSFQHDEILMRHYHIYHDCGKSFSQIIDQSGKKHYPDHANKSCEIHNIYFDCFIANELIKYDMIFHTLKSENLSAWLLENKYKKYLIASLYLTAWAEIFANSSMFGGEQSDSFKIKRKKLNSVFKKIKIYLEPETCLISTC